MGEAHPSLRERRAHVERVLLQEEERFAETLSQGMRLLEDVVERLPSGGEIPGETVFKLYDTYGFPEDLTADFAREHGYAVDHAGFAAAMDEQRRRAREASRFGAAGAGAKLLAEAVRIGQERDIPATRFLGYEHHAARGTVVALFTHDGEPVDALHTGDDGVVVLDATPFYAESGGQVGDRGQIWNAETALRVGDTRKLGAYFGHFGRVERGTLELGMTVDAEIDGARRAATVLNHSATHLLHAALRQVLGDHVQQKGSLVAPDRLRFDFAHYEPIAAGQLREIERLVNAEIRSNAAADTKVMGYDAAIAAGALAFFDDKYGDEVRVLRLGEFSVELCGGTHVTRVGDIGLFKITSESGVAAGVRRIEAVTGQGALDWIDNAEASLLEVAALVKAGREEVAPKVAQLVDRSRGLEREVQALKTKLASGESRDLVAEAHQIGGVNLLVARIDGTDAKMLRDRADHLKDKLGSGIVILGAVDEGKVRLVVSVSTDLTGTHKAGDLIAPIAADVGGRGGGRPDFAQAGGTLPEKLDEALAAAKTRFSG
jgi:alanyl-tRNA synthetase